MKKTLLLSLICFAVIPWSVSAQSTDEIAIRKLSALEVESFLKSDTTSLSKLWAPAYVVMNPFNRIVTTKEIKGLIKNAKITQVRFERLIDRVTINEQIAFEMGQEIPDEKSAGAGVPKNVTSPRRYTNIWQKTNTGWQIIGRQATNVCP